MQDTETYRRTTAPEASEQFPFDASSHMTYCERCRRRPATKKRRLLTAVATRGLPQPVCLPCAQEIDDEAETCALAAITVDRAVRRYRGELRFGT